ncbi:MAG: carboxypeptidase regulatory-like domain-containing protein [Acidobacteria bacterium]|nr:carboxypeptidase regulatory-like domain-containing protein [Acidobacteriota bacterium]
MTFMNSQFEIRSVRRMLSSALAAVFALCLIAVGVSAQAPPNPPPPPENIPAGALVIPMDNVNQGNAAGTTFNLRAYGLANLLLQNNIPVKWAIKPGKAKDAADFSANVTRISGSAGVAGPSNVNFSGGPFIISADYDTQSLRDLITSFNAGGTDVVVYKTNAATTADIRYLLTHKPKIAIGPDGGNFGTGVHQDVFDAAGIPNYESVTDDIINMNSCYTLATQAHSTSSQFVNLYKQFVISGGNLLLQCASVNTFENNANGHFQTTNPGYDVFGTNDDTDVNTALVYPEGAMPFNQFIGILANQDGAVTEYRYASGAAAANDNRISVRNSGNQSAKMVATVSELSGAGAAGSTVFELGGHDYSRTNTGASLIERLNGQRMILNTVFVPVTRPQACGLQQATVNGYKSVRRFNDRQGGPPLVPGDTLEWTIDYVNNSPVAVSNFNIRDEVSAIDGSLTGNLTLVAGSNTVTITSGGAVATRNTNYDGLGNDPTSDLLAPGASLPVGGRIQVKVRMTINTTTSTGDPLPNGTILWNQTLAHGAQIVGEVKSDAIDWTNTSIFGVDTPPADSFLQFQNAAILDPTIARIKTPTAAEASIEGDIRTASGAPIANAMVSVVNASNGQVKTARADASGRYVIEGLPVNNVYFVSVRHKLYSFGGGPVTLSITDSVTGVDFTGSPVQVKPGKMPTTTFRGKQAPIF